MERTEPCGCIVDYRPIEPPTGATNEPLVEFIKRYCQVHQPVSE